MFGMWALLSAPLIVNADIRLFTIKWSSPHIRCVPVMIS